MWNYERGDRGGKEKKISLLPKLIVGRDLFRLGFSKGSTLFLICKYISLYLDVLFIKLLFAKFLFNFFLF